MDINKHLLPIFLLAALLCGCAGGVVADTQSMPASTTATAIKTEPIGPILPPDFTTMPTLPITVPPTVLPTVPVVPAPEVNVYAGAMEDYLLPLETYSDERLYLPEMIMIHFCSAVKIDKDDPYNMDLVRGIFIDNEVSTHYIIERDGTVRCYIPEDRVAWHAGKGTWGNDEKYTNKMNQYAIGIELVAMGSKSDMAGYMSGSFYDSLDQSLMGFTDAQYAALRALVHDLCVRYEIPLDRAHIIGYEEFGSKKPDPGDLFDWSRVVPDTQ